MAITVASLVSVAQEKDKPKEKWGEGEIEKVEIEIVKDRQIVLPKANRNFEKVPPRPAEPAPASPQSPQGPPASATGSPRQLSPSASASLTGSPCKACASQHIDSGSTRIVNAGRTR